MADEDEANLDEPDAEHAGPASADEEARNQITVFEAEAGWLERLNAQAELCLPTGEWRSILGGVTPWESPDQWAASALSLVKSHLADEQALGHKYDEPGLETHETDVALRLARAQIGRAELALEMLRHAVTAGDANAAALLGIHVAENVEGAHATLAAPWRRRLRWDSHALTAHRIGQRSGGWTLRNRARERMVPFHHLEVSIRREHPEWNAAAIWTAVVAHPDAPKGTHGQPYNPETVRRAVTKYRNLVKRSEPDKA
jgi:hypothetical protein